MKKLLLGLLIGLGMTTGIVYAANVFHSNQVGTSAGAGKILQTNGIDSTWVATSTLGITGSTLTGNGTTSQVTYWNGTTSLTGNNNFTFNGSNLVSLNGALNASTSVITTATHTNLTLLNPLAVTSGGTGTTTPGLIQGSNITITGTWPFQTINSTASGGSGATTTINGLSTTAYTFTAGTGISIATSAPGTITFTNIAAGSGATTTITAGAKINGPDFIFASSSNANNWNITASGNTVTFNNPYNLISTSTTLTVNSIPIATGGATLGNSSLSQSAGTTFINGATPIIDGGGDWLNNVIQTSGANFIVQTPTSTAVLGNLIQSGGVQYYQQTANITAAQFCSGGLYNVASTVPITLTFPTLTQIGTSPCGGTQPWASGFAAQYGVNTGSSTFTLAASGSGETLLYAPGSGANLYPGQVQFATGQFIATSTIQGATTTGMSLQAYIADFQPTSTAPTTQGQILAADQTGHGWALTNLVAGSNITITTSTLGQITIASTASGGGGAGGGFATSSPNYITTTYPNTTGANVGINSSTPIAQLSVVGISGSTTPIFVVASSSNVANLIITSAGNVGINTTTPNQKLSVVGNINIDNQYGYYLGGKSLLTASSTNFNTSLGFQALNVNTGTSIGQTAVGYQALQNKVNSSGPAQGLEGDTAVGYQALNKITDKNENSALGYQALFNNQDSANTGIGYQAGYNLVSGDQSTIVGMQAGFTMATTDRVTLLGSDAMYLNRDGSLSVAIGQGAAYGNTQYSNSQGTYVGFFAGRNLITGSDNNVFLGYQAGYTVSSGSKNTLLGYQAGYDLDTGTNNIVLGYNTDLPASTTSNTLDIGNLIYATGLTPNSSPTAALSAGYVGIGTSSPIDNLSVVGTISASNLVSGNCVQAAIGGRLTTTGSACGSGGGGSGGGWATSSPAYITTTYPSTTGALVGINTSTPTAQLTVEGTTGTTTPVFIVASSSNASTLTVASNGNISFNLLGTGIIHSSSVGLLSSSAIVNADIQNATIDLTAKVTGVLPVANGGTGTSTAPTVTGQILAADGTGTKYAPANLVAGSNITITTTTPGQITIASSASGGGGSGGGFATSSPNYITTTYPNTTGANVGINSSTPIAQLSVVGISGSTTPVFVVASSTGASQFTVASNGNVSIAKETTGSVLFAGASGLINQNNSQLFWDNSSNLLGIGTASPQYPLDVNGDININSVSSYRIGLTRAVYASSSLQTTLLGFAGQTFPPLNETAVGYNSLVNTTGTGNTAVGAVTGTTVSSGASNTFVGYGIAGVRTVTGNENAYVGANSFDQGNGSFNSGVGAGVLAGFNGNSFSGNSAIGYYAGDFIEGSYNNFFGYKSNYQNGGSAQLTGSYNISIGTSGDVASSSLSGQLNIGNVLWGTGMYQNSVTESALPVAGGKIGIGTTTPIATFSIVGEGTAIPLLVSSSTGTTLFQISQNGSTTLSSLATAGLVRSTSGGSLYVDATSYQPALSGGIIGTDAIWATASTLGNGKLIDNGTVLGMNATSSTIGFNIQGTGGTNTIFNVASSSGTSILAITPNSKIGIGTSTATGLLTLQGSSGFANDLFDIASSTGANIFSVAAASNATLSVGTTTVSSTLFIQGSGTSNIVTVASGTGATLYSIDSVGHIHYGGATPSVSSCGTSPSVTGNDTIGDILTGSASPTACTLTFANAYNNVNCVVADDLQTSEVSITSTSTTAIVMTMSAALNSHHIYYQCADKK